jgi:hypothetical protein
MRSYRERLRVPVMWWVLGAVSVLLIGTGVWAGLGWYWPVITYVVLFGLVGSVLLNWNSAVIEVADGRLRAGRDTLPLEAAGDVVALDERQAAALRGPRADPAAHLLIRPYAKLGVYIEVTDGGSVPYWFLSTRKPEELAAAIQGSHETVG